MKRMIKPLTSEHIEDYLTIYLNAYPAYKNIGDEGREKYRPKVLFSMENDKHIHFYGLFEDDELLATMKLIDLSVNFFGKIQPASGLMALGVHPLHKKKGVAKDMVKFFEKYTKESGSLVAMLLPFRMDFYRQMGYGYGSKLDEYRIPTVNLPKADKDSLCKLKFLSSSDLDDMLCCHRIFASKNHGMAEKFEDEIRNMESDSQTRRIGYVENDKLLGYVSYRLVSESDVNYTLNRMEVDEIVYLDSNILKCLLGFLRNQSDLAQTIVLRTGNENFYHILPSPQDISGNYIDFGYLQTNVSAVGNMYKIVDPKAFINATHYRKFISCKLNVKFIYDDELEHCTNSITVGFESDGSWHVADDKYEDVTIKCKLSDLSSLFMGSCGLSSMMKLGAIKLSDPSYEDLLDMLFYCKQKPWTNTDY